MSDNLPLSLSDLRAKNADNPKYSALGDDQLASLYQQKTGKFPAGYVVPTQASVAQAQDYVAGLREKNKDNPKYNNLSDVQLAEIYKKKTGDQRLNSFIESGSLIRGVGKFGTGWSEGVNAVLGKPTEDEGILQGTARSLLEGVPEAAILGASALFAEPTLGGSVALGIPAASALAGTRQYARTGDKLSSYVTAGATGLGGLVAGPMAKVGTSVASTALGEAGINQAARALGRTEASGLAKVTGSFGGNLAAAVPLTAAQELTVPTGTPADESLLARASMNAERLLSPSELKRLTAQTILMTGVGEAGALGTKFVGRRISQRSKVPLVNSEQEGFSSYEDALAFLNKEGLPADSFNKPSTILEVASLLRSGRPFAEETAKYRLAQDRSTEEYTDPSDQLIIQDYEDRVAPALRARELGKIVLAGSLNKTRADKVGLQNLNYILNEESLQNLVRDNPEGFENYATSWNKLPLEQRKARLSGLKLPADAVALDSVGLARQSLDAYRNGQLSADDLLDLHPMLAEAARLGDSAKQDLFRNSKILKDLGKDGERDFALQAKLTKAIDKRSEAYRDMRRFLDSNQVKSKLESEVKTGEEMNVSFEDQAKGKGIGAIEKYFLGTIGLDARYPGGLISRHLFEITQLAKSAQLRLFSELGQNKERNLPEQTAFTEATNWLDSLSPKERLPLDKAFEQDYKNAQSYKGLVSDEALRVMGLSEDNLRRYKTLRDMPAKVVQHAAQVEHERNVYDVGGMIYLASGKKMRQQDALAISKQIHDFAASQDVPSEGTQARQVYEDNLLAMLRQTSNAYGFKWNEGDVRIIEEAVVKQRDQELNFAKRKGALGYLPTQRRGKYGAVLAKPGSDMENLTGKDKITVDGDAQADVTARLNALLKSGYRLVGKPWNKETWKKGESYLDYDAIRNIMDEYTGQRQALVDKWRKRGDMSPAMEEMMNDFAYKTDAFEEAFQRSIDRTSAQYDQHKEFVEGFNKAQFLPNILDHARINTVAAERRLSKAKVAFELLRPLYDEVPGLKQEWQHRAQYAYGLDNAQMNKLRTLAVHLAIGGSFRNFALNCTQNFMVGLPVLAERTGSIKAAEVHMTKGLAFLTKYNLNGSTGNVILDRIARQADRDGITTSNNLDLYFKTTSLDSSSKQRPLITYSHKIGDNLARLNLSNQALSERLNRLTSLFAEASFELSKRGNPKNVSEAELKTIYTRASDFSNQVNYFGSRSNRPGFVTHASPGVVHNSMLALTTLRTFQLNYLGQLYGMFKANGGFKTALKQKPIQLALLHMLVAGGLYGLPETKDLEQALSAFLGKDVAAKIKETAESLVDETGLNKLSDLFSDHPTDRTSQWADSILYGLPAYFGSDISSSLGAGSLLNYYGRANASENLVENVAGPIASLGWGLGKGAQQLATGEKPTELVSSVTPASVRYWKNLIEAGTTSKVSRQSGAPLDASRNTTSSLLLGFTPMSIANQRRDETTKMYAKAGRARDKAQVADRVSEAFVQGDIDEAREAFKKGLVDLGPSQDPTDLLQMVSRRVLERRLGKTFSVNNEEDAETARRSQRLYAENAMPITSPITELAAKVELALKMQNKEALTSVLRGLPSSTKTALVKELLLRKRIAPGALDALKKGRTDLENFRF
jgi:hypothetical protein